MKYNDAFFFVHYRHDLNDLALNIAIKLNEHDLFMDLYYYAKHTDNAALLATAWEKAEQILAEDSAANPNSGICTFNEIEIDIIS